MLLQKGVYHICHLKNRASCGSYKTNRLCLDCTPKEVYGEINQNNEATLKQK